MLAQLNKKLWDWWTVWNAFLAKTEVKATLQRDQHRLLVFFHGYSLAHTIRPLVIARVLRARFCWPMCLNSIRRPGRCRLPITTSGRSSKTSR